MSKTIPLTQSKIATVDDEDYNELSKHKWYAKLCSKKWYAGRDLKKCDGTKGSVYMHRIILGVTDPTVQVDHADGDGLNNCRLNLRQATNAQNNWNKGNSSNNTSGYKWVSLDHGKWRADIQANGVRKYLGLYDTPEEAHNACVKAAERLHGEFARSGKIEDLVKL